jgi:hypothetical protein
MDCIISTHHVKQPKPDADQNAGRVLSGDRWDDIRKYQALPIKTKRWQSGKVVDKLAQSFKVKKKEVSFLLKSIH